MKDRKRKVMCIGFCFALAGAMLTACGSDETAGAEVRGRITSISEQEITLEITNHPEGEKPEGENRGGKKPDGVSGSAVEGKEKPEGTPPADKTGEKASHNVSGSAIGRENRETESKTYSVSKNTKIYTQQGEEKTEVSLSDLELGSMVSVTVSGDEAESITVQTRNQRQGEKTES